ncbi:MAG: response regulator [Gammaproteobacteria bacterium]
MTNASVLIIDDDEVDRYLLKRLLKKTQFAFDIFEADDGTSALRFLKGHEENKLRDTSKSPPLIMFLDINMPIMRGPEFLSEFSKVRSRAFDRSCVIIMFSSSERKEDMDHMLRYDFVKDYLVKGSFDSNELALRIENVIDSTLDDALEAANDPTKHI